MSIADLNPWVVFWLGMLAGGICSIIGIIASNIGSRK